MYCGICFPPIEFCGLGADSNALRPIQPIDERSLRNSTGPKNISACAIGMKMEAKKARRARKAKSPFFASFALLAFFASCQSPFSFSL
jgi:hypothetical protein